jgi:predicted nucleic acid-binding Zn ribbon protein
MAAQKLGALLGAAGDFKTLVAKTRRLAEWQQRYSVLVPPELARASRVAGFRSGSLILRADNGAVAAKLRQLAPRLTTALNKQGNEVTSIRIQVQPASGPRGEGQRLGETRLPARAVEAFAKLGADLPDSALKSAVEALVARHRRRVPPR